VLEVVIKIAGELHSREEFSKRKICKRVSDFKVRRRQTCLS
jgi:hypothetical protein